MGTPKKIEKQNAVPVFGSPARRQQQKKIIKIKHQGWVDQVVRKGNGAVPFGFLKYIDTADDDSADDESANKQEEKEIFFSFHNVQSNLLDLQRGDQIEFSILDNKNNNNNNRYKTERNRPKAINITILKLAHRKAPVLFEYIELIKNLLSSSDNRGARKRYIASLGSTGSRQNQLKERKSDEICQFHPRQVMASPVTWQCVARQVSFFQKNYRVLFETFLECVI